MIPKSLHHKHQWIKKSIKANKVDNIRYKGGSPNRTIVGYVCTKVLGKRDGKPVYCLARDYIDLING